CLTATQADAYARRGDWSNSTRHDFLTALATAFRWAGHPIQGLKKPPKESRGDKALVSADAHAKLYEAAPTHFKPFLALLHLTGGRPAEIAAIAAENFDEARGMVRLKQHKPARHGKSRIILLCPEAVRILREQQAKHGCGHLLRNRLGVPFTKDAVVH